MGDYIAVNIEVAIHVAQLKDSNLLARQLAESPRILVIPASRHPGTLGGAGMRSMPHDLAGRQCRPYFAGARIFDNWTLLRGSEATVVQVSRKIQSMTAWPWSRWPAQVAASWPSTIQEVKPASMRDRSRLNRRLRPPLNALRVRLRLFWGEVCSAVAGGADQLTPKRCGEGLRTA